MTCEMEVLDHTGHLTLSWDPDDQASVERAQQEFERLRAAGYAFFVSTEPDAGQVKRLKPQALSEPGWLDVRAARVFEPRARRQVAVRPMRGG